MKSYFRRSPRARWVLICTTLAAVTAFLGFGVYTVREVFVQHDRVAAAEAGVGDLRAEIDRLRERRKQLNDPTEIELIARRDHGLVFPGEETYRLADAAAGPQLPTWVTKGMALRDLITPVAAPSTGGNL